MLLLPESDRDAIQQQLKCGKRLIVGLCASWCNNCADWRRTVSLLAEKYREFCFVWLDIDEHADMVAEVDLETLPVLLVQDNDQVLFLGSVIPKKDVTERIIQNDNAMMNIANPGIWDFLLED